ncbi:type II secretion system major pseudopilin GspG [Candidatus Dependentiae bacterium]
MVIKKSSAFTMFEILIVLVILGTLITFLWGPLTKMIGKSDVNLTNLKLEKLKSSLMQYKMDVGHYPRKKEGGLRALLEKPSGETNWRGPYIDREDDLLDKWDGEIIFNAPPERYKNKVRFFELISLGEDGQEGGEGDASEIVKGG